MNVIILLSQVA